MAKKRASAASLTLALPNALTIDSIESFTTNLIEKISPKTREMTLQACSVELLTTPGIQCLLSLQKTLQQQDASMQLQVADGDAVSRAFEHAGLAAILHALSNPTPANGDVRE